MLIRMTMWSPGFIYQRLLLPRIAVMANGNIDFFFEEPAEGINKIEGVGNRYRDGERNMTEHSNSWQINPGDHIVILINIQKLK